MKNAPWLLLFAVSFVLLAGCKGDPKSPEYWDKAIGNAKRVKDKVRVVEDLRASNLAGPTFVPMLTQHLTAEKSPEVKEVLAKTLGGLKDPSAVNPLIGALDFGNTERTTNAMNKEIIAALGRLGDARAIPPLLRMLKARDPYVQIEAISALGALKAKDAVEPLMEIVADESGETFTCKKAIQALGDIGDPRATPLLIKMMFKDRRSVSFYGESSYALFQVGRPAADALITALKGEDRALASWAKQNNIVEPVIYAKSSQVLADLRDPRAERPLVGLLGFKSEFDDLRLVVRVKAAEALGQLRATEAIKPLVAMLQEPEPNAREKYIQSLIAIGGREPLRALEKAASEGTWDARESALGGIAMLGDERELPLLDKLAASEAALTHKECKDEPSTPGCDKAPELVKKHAEQIAAYRARLDAAKQCKTDAACWSQKLDDPAPRVRQRAALELGRSGQADRVTDLVKHLKEPDLETRAALIQAVGWLTSDNKQAWATAHRMVSAVEQQLADEKGKTEFVKVNEDLKRLAYDLNRDKA